MLFINNITKERAFHSVDNKKITHIFLDPGHGGRDTGAFCYSIAEKDITLQIALDLKKLLQKHHPKKVILLTRSDDTYVSLEDRCKFVNKFIEPPQNGKGVFISLHLNYWFSPQTRGMEVFYPRYKKSHQIQKVKNSLGKSSINDKNLLTTEKIFSVLKNQNHNQNSFLLSKILEISTKKNRSYLFRGAKPEFFHVLKTPKMISLLIELGFISNHQDMSILMEKNSRKELLLLIANSIGEFMQYIQGNGSSLSGITLID